MDCSPSILRKLNRFSRLGVANQAILLKALLLVSAMRAGLWVLPFRILRGWVSTACGRALKHRGRARQPATIATDAVRIAALYIPGATCLTQALAAQLLLAHGGHPSTLRIGVLRTEENRFKAHAWVECDQAVVIGDVPEMGEFRVLPKF